MKQTIYLYLKTAFVHPEKVIPLFSNTFSGLNLTLDFITLNLSILLYNLSQYHIYISQYQIHSICLNIYYN